MEEGTIKKIAIYGRKDVDSIYAGREMDALQSRDEWRL